MDTRIKKILKELISNKSKTALIILTLFVGMISVGVVVMINTVFVPDVYNEYLKAVPKDVSIKCSSGYDNSLLDDIGRIPEVNAAVGRNTITARVMLEKGTLNADFIAFDETNTINRIRMGDGSGALPKLLKNEVFFERAAMQDIGKKPGDKVRIMYAGKEFELVIKEAVYDATTEPYMLEGDVISFINQDTFKMLTGDGRFNEILLTVNGDNSDRINNMEAAEKAAALLEAKGIEVAEIVVPVPGEFYASEIIDSVVIVMALLGGIAILLGSVLIINNINNIMHQQIKQIGIMKAIGGRTRQISIMYFAFVLTIGMLALALSLPVSALVGYKVSEFLAKMFNMSLSGLRIPFELLIAQIAGALVIPLLVSVIPVMKSARMTVYDTLNNNLKGTAFRDIKLPNILNNRFKHMPMAVLVSLRNNLRSKPRVFLTVSTLTLSGAVIITVMSLNLSFKDGMNELKDYYVVDGTMMLDSFQDANRLENMIKDIDGVEEVEGWAFTVARFVENGSKSSRKVKLIGPKPDSRIFSWETGRQRLVEGRQIAPGDTNAVVITNHLTNSYPDLKVGDVISFKIRDKIYDFDIVGIMSMAGQPADPVLLANYSYLNSLLEGRDMVMDVRVSTSGHTLEYQQSVIGKVEKRLNQNGITLMETLPGADLLEKFSTPCNVIVALLMFMAIMITIVGTIGQSGTLNLNVLERTREYGIMRSIGASNKKLNASIVSEGMIIGVVSWFLGILVSFPLTVAANSLIGTLLFNAPLSYRFHAAGIMLWLVLTIIASCLASILPCRKLNKMVTREILIYE